MSDKFFHRGKEARSLGLPRELHDARISPANRQKFFEGWDAQDRFMRPELSLDQHAEIDASLSGIRDYLNSQGYKSERSHTLSPPSSGLITLSVKFPPGDYRSAISYYHVAQEWSLTSGLCFRKDLAGIIHAPAHPLSPADQLEVPVGLYTAEDWQTIMDITCATEQAAADVERLQLPNGATLHRL